MADTLTTIASLLKLADQNLAPEFASDLLQFAPLLSRMRADTANASQGTQHKYLKHTSAPSVGFRAPNTGIDYTASGQTLVTVDLKNLSANVRMDTQIADAYPKGHEAILDIESELALKEAFKMAELQILYGTAEEAGGFVGLLEASTVATLAGSMVVNAGGSGAACSSVLAIKFGPRDCELIVGRDGNITTGPTYKQSIADSTGKLFPAYLRDQEALMTVKVGSAHSIGAIRNLSVANPLTDARIYSLFELFPDGLPDLLVMSHRSLGQLRTSRTPTSQKGTPAPYPTEVEGVPILWSQNVKNDEAALV